MEFTETESSQGNSSLTCPHTCYLQVNRSCDTLCRPGQFIDSDEVCKNKLNMLGPLLPVQYEVLGGQPGGQVLVSHLSTRESLPQAPEYSTRSQYIGVKQRQKAAECYYQLLGGYQRKHGLLPKIHPTHSHPFHGQLPHHLVHDDQPEVFTAPSKVLSLFLMIPLLSSNFAWLGEEHIFKDTTQMNPLLTSLWEKLSSSVKPSNHQQLTESSSPSGPSASWPTPSPLSPAIHSCQQSSARLAGVPP